jgi:hypothetical protein
MNWLSIEGGSWLAIIELRSLTDLIIRLRDERSNW